MKNFDATFITNIEAENYSYFWLIEFQFASNYYYTDCDIPVYYNGHSYVPRNFQFPSVVQSSSMSVDEITIEVDNVDLTLSALILSQDIRNKPVIISFGVRDTSGGTEQLIVEQMFYGIVGEWKILGDTKVEITIVNEFIYWNKKSLRNHSPSCQWAFKGVECKYAGGADWCDKSFDRCSNINNDENYGGFRWLPSIADKEIWWGRVRGS